MIFRVWFYAKLANALKTSDHISVKKCYFVPQSKQKCFRNQLVRVIQNIVLKILWAVYASGLPIPRCRPDGALKTGNNTKLMILTNFNGGGVNSDFFNLPLPHEWKRRRRKINFPATFRWVMLTRMTLT